MARKPNQAPIVIPPSPNSPTGWHYYPPTDVTVVEIEVEVPDGAPDPIEVREPPTVSDYVHVGPFTTSASTSTVTHPLEETMADPVDREERRDDEELDEYFGTTWKANLKEGFDLFRGDDRYLFRALLKEYLSDKAQERRHAEEMHDMRMRHKEEMFASRVRDQHQSMAHRDLAIAQQWRDQARDSGESVFKPEQSS